MAHIRSRGSRGSGKKDKRKRRFRNGTRGSSRIETVSFTKLRREMARRLRRLPGLENKRDTLIKKIKGIDQEIAELGGSSLNGTLAALAKGSGRKRPQNAVPLATALAATLKDKVMSVTDVSEAVQKDGYRTTSPSFRTIVNQTLINRPDLFKRVDRGQYTVK